MYKFEPLLKQTLWGGDKIIPFKHLDTQMENVGESWEISGVENNETIVANGPEKGKSLNQLVREHKDELVGKDNYCSYLGQSAVINPIGKTLIHCQPNQESIATVEIDLETVNHYRNKFAVLEDRDLF